MSLSVGAHLGPYEIVAAIGAGGMGSACGRCAGAPVRQPRWGGMSKSASRGAGAGHLAVGPGPTDADAADGRPGVGQPSGPDAGRAATPPSQGFGEPGRSSTSEVRPLLATPFTERNGQVSPDGRWLAYESNETGQVEIYVRRLPEVEAGKWPVSTGAGRGRCGARSGRELFYRAPDGAVLGVRVDAEGERFRTSTPATLVDGRYFAGGGAFIGRTYDVAPDCARFLMIKEGDGVTDAAAPAPTIWTPRGYAPLAPGLSAASAFGLFMPVCLAQTGSLFAADAWNNITFTAGEVKNPRRGVPLALALGTGIVIALYLLANLAYIVTLPIAELQTVPADRVAAATLHRILPDIGAVLMAVAIMISTFGCANALVLPGPVGGRTVFPKGAAT